MNHRSLTALLLLVACRTHGEPPPEVPETIEVVDSEHATHTRDRWAPRYVRPEHAQVPPPIEDANEPPCVEPPPPEPPRPIRMDEPVVYELEDSVVTRQLEREVIAHRDPPSVHCHIYVGERVERHLGIRGGQRTNLRIGDLLLEISFWLDAYEGSRFAIELRKRDQIVLQYGRLIWLSNMPPSCGGNGFTGSLNPAQVPEVRLFCESARVEPH